jgi:hypothetical protein
MKFNAGPSSMRFKQKSDADILADAREYLESHGWWRGSLRGPNGRQVCGLGAIVYSQGWETISTGTYTGRHHEQVTRLMGKLLAVALKVRKGTPHAAHDFTSWNDHLAKNKQEVLDVFAKAEKIERAKFDPDQGLSIDEL